MTTAIEKDTDMSKEPIYPLPEYDPGDEVPRSVNERLAPIFRELADDPDGYSIEVWDYDYADWIAWYGGVGNMISAMESAHTHDGTTTTPFRLVPKRRTITVEIPVPERVVYMQEKSISGLYGFGCRFKSKSDADEAHEAIRKAMGEQE